MYSQNYSLNSQLKIWMITLLVMIVLIILVGGLTRLTDSGLSMVDWRPILGTLPPFNNNQWLDVFNDYKLTPEFLYVNKNMTLEEFKYRSWIVELSKRITLFCLLIVIYFTFI